MLMDCFFFFLLFFHADSGSVALYSTQDDEPLTMNCDIDGTSGCTQLCLCSRGPQAASCDRKKTLCWTCMSVTHVLVISGENQVEVEEKTRLINQVLELQHTLEGTVHKTHVVFLEWELPTVVGQVDKLLFFFFKVFKSQHYMHVFSAIKTLKIMLYFHLLKWGLALFAVHFLTIRCH